MNAIDTVFKPFTWLPDGANSASDRLLVQSKDLAAGAVSILALLERDQLNRLNDEAPILSEFHAGSMLRMAISSLSLLVDSVDQHIDHLNEKCNKGGPN